jgi:hypothetical protein
LDVAPGGSSTLPPFAIKIVSASKSKFRKVSHDLEAVLQIVRLYLSDDDSIGVVELQSPLSQWVSPGRCSLPKQQELTMRN